MATRRARQQAKKRRGTKPRASPLRLVRRAQLAQIFGVVPLRITKWTQAGMPVASRGGPGRESRYSLPDVIEWRIQSEVQRRTGGTAGGDLNVAIESAKLKRAQTRKTELEIRKREGELVETKEIATLWSNIVAAIRSGVLSIPKAAAVICVEAAREGDEAIAAVERILTAKVHDVLRELAGWKQPEAVPQPTQEVA